ncbi:MAG: aromatic ring-hydroxylating dioxygenase subunit alpha [Gammaproteobacteria bacterium]|nr:aromatic ring-hydroxylating dioxygenase subunit alpha [Gammaproteobacteria bacterium]
MFEGLVRDSSVDGRVYTSREVFAAEIERIFARSWSYLGHLSEIPRPGDYRRVSVAGRELIFIRHRDGTPRALLNRCAHRGAQLIGKACGRARRLRCAYHGWTYGTDGALKQLPLPDGYVGEDAPRAGHPDWALDAYPVETYRDFAFVRLQTPSNPLPLEKFLGPAREALDLMADRSPSGSLSIAGGRLAIVLGCNWKVYLENLHDGVHPPAVHESSIAAARAAARVDEPPQEVQWVAANGQPLAVFGDLKVRCHPYGHSDMSGFRKEADGEDPAYRQALAEAWGAERAGQALTRNLHNACFYPGASAHPQYMQMRRLTPLAVDRTLVESWTLRAEGAPESHFRRNIRYANTIHSPSSLVKPDDAEAYRRVQRGLESSSGRVSQHRREAGPRDGGTSTALDEEYVRAQYRAWREYMTAGR